MNSAKTVLLAQWAFIFGGGLARLFSTHPPMEERIARLEGMAHGQGASH